MCGIFIAYRPCGISKDNISAYKSAINTVVHRGPDNLGSYVDDYVFMGHTRLSIIDTAGSANQPFEDGELILCFNGEIFNYEEIRDELVEFGWKFATQSDTEVLIKSFRQWGQNCFTKFNGMWSAVIYDKENNSIVVSRDRFGQKPLFVSLDDGYYYFASEAHQIAGLNAIKPNYAAIKLFLQEGDFKSNGHTFFDGIYDFPASHTYTIDKYGKVQGVQYWDYPCCKEIKTQEESYLEFEKILKDAVKLRLRSDVPSAVCLSGGVDSTLITDIIRELVGKNERIDAYTFKSLGGFDESGYAKIVANRLGCIFHIVQQETRPETLKKQLEKLVYRLGRGHSSPAILSYDAIERQMRSDGFKVSIDGQGADELLGGYQTFYFELLFEQLFEFRAKHFANTFSTLKTVAKNYRFGIIYLFIQFLRAKSPRFIRKLMRTVYGTERFFSDHSDIDLNTISPLMGADFKRPRKIGLNSHLIDQHGNSLRNLLYYGDIVSMSNSIENRSPFLDHRLVEYTFAFDAELKVSNGVGKAALKKMSRYAKYADVLDRKKNGFEGQMPQKFIDFMLVELRKSDVISMNIFSKKLETFLYTEAAKSSKHQRFLFRLYQVHLWKNIFFNKPFGSLGI